MGVGNWELGVDLLLDVDLAGCAIGRGAVSYNGSSVNGTNRCYRQRTAANAGECSRIAVTRGAHQIFGEFVLAVRGWQESSMWTRTTSFSTCPCPHHDFIDNRGPTGRGGDGATVRSGARRSGPEVRACEPSDHRTGPSDLRTGPSHVRPFAPSDRRMERSYFDSVVMSR